jgi:hypothetical protein
MLNSRIGAKMRQSEGRGTIEDAEGTGYETI